MSLPLLSPIESSETSEDDSVRCDLPNNSVMATAAIIARASFGLWLSSSMFDSFLVSALKGGGGRILETFLRSTVDLADDSEPALGESSTASAGRLVGFDTGVVIWPCFINTMGLLIASASHLGNSVTVVFDTARVGGGDDRNRTVAGGASDGGGGGGGGPNDGSGKLRQLVQRQFNPQWVSF